MRIGHFEQLRPICPVCVDRTVNFESPLCIQTVERDDPQHIIEGVLQCSNPNCMSEFPIIDGIPIIHPRLRAYVSDSCFQIYARRELSESCESILGDCCSQGSSLDTMRQQLSSYVWDHYADSDPQEVAGDVRPGSVVRLLEQGLASEVGSIDGPILDAGCGVGRTAFNLAERTDQLVLGIDIHFAMLRVAANVLRTGKVRYARRHIGLVYDHREFPVALQSTERVDFWACDALALPFANATFGRCVVINALDSVASPYGLLTEIERTTISRGHVLLACPYDWTTTVTPVEAWIGGHSQRAPDRGDCGTRLRNLFVADSGSIAGLALEAESQRVPWTVRLHDRCTIKYDVHVVNLRRK